MRSSYPGTFLLAEVDTLDYWIIPRVKNFGLWNRSTLLKRAERPKRLNHNDYHGVRVGETLPPPARSLLDHLRIWDRFCRLSPREVFGTSALWGSSIAADNDFFYMPANTGWHVERNSFDAMLANAASERGAALVLGSSLKDVEQSGDCYRLNLSTGATLQARFIVDATRAAMFARRWGARFQCLDRLVGIVRFFEGGADGPGLLVEAFEDG
jgi:hypothetical protein